MNELAGLVAFAFVSSVTPGPNNVLLWASGTAFGFRRTARHIAGTALGLGGMALAVAAGLGAVISAIPDAAIAMKLVGSLYLLYLAVQIGRSGSLRTTAIGRPFGLVSAASFQLVNPKAWIFALGAITTFRPPGLPIATGSVIVAGTMMAVIVPTASLWAAAGGAISRLASNDRARRAVSLVLAALVVATVALVWA